MEDSKKEDKINSFEDLRIWQEARELVKDIYSDFQEGSAGQADFVFK